MITFKPLWWFALLLVLTMPFYLFADSNAVAAGSQLGVERFNLTSTDAISRETTIGNIMARISRDFNGEIKVVWTNDRFAESAKHLRDGLIAQGIAPYRIVLARDAGGYREQGSNGVEIVVQQIALRLPECNDRSQSYRFDGHADLGCALNNTRSRSLVSPFQYYF